MNNGGFSENIVPLKSNKFKKWTMSSTGNIYLFVQRSPFISTYCQPIFEWNHRRVMQSGEQSLIQRLNLGMRIQ